MGQSPSLLALRKRMHKRGYTEIHIARAKAPRGAADKTAKYYKITAREPLAGRVVSVTVTEASCSARMR